MGVVVVLVRGINFFVFFVYDINGVVVLVRGSRNGKLLLF